MTMKSALEVSGEETSYMGITYILLDAGRHVTVFGLTYFNGGEYPIPPTALVGLTEFLKLFIAILYTCCKGGSARLRTVQTKYLIPALLFVLSDNIYFYAIPNTSPPYWNFLMCSRVVVAWLAWKIFYHRTISDRRELSTILLGIMIFFFVTVKYLAGSLDLTTETIACATACILMTTAGAIVTEGILQVRSTPVSACMIQMFICSTAVSATVHLSIGASVSKYVNMTHEYHKLVTLGVGSLLTATMCGFLTGNIRANLDSFALYHLQGLSNVIVTLACLYIYPDRFHNDALYYLCIFIANAGMIWAEGSWFPGLRWVAPRSLPLVNGPKITQNGHTQT